MPEENAEEIQSKSNENYLINRNRYFMRPHPLDRILGENGNGKEQNDDVMSFGRDLIFFLSFLFFSKRHFHENCALNEIDNGKRMGTRRMSLTR